MLTRRNKGQVILLTAIIVAGVVMAATSLAGLLTLYELRQVTDVKNSSAAIFAADAGTECLSYQWTKDSSLDCSNGTLTNGARFTTTSTPSGTGFISIGTSGRSNRAFKIDFSQFATST